jgi:two-component system NarL family sensor kinase
MPKKRKNGRGRLQSPAQVGEPQETARAIRRGAADAVDVQSSRGDQMLTPQDAEHPYRLLVETIDEGAATLSDDGTLLYSNARFAKIFDVPLENFVGKPLQTFVFGVELANLEALLEKGRIGVARGEIRITTADGRPRTVRLTLSPSRQRGAETVCAVATELTELIETNEALRVTETSLRQLSGRLLQLQDEERRRIARDLHDITGQEIAFLSMSLDRLARLIDPATTEMKDSLDECREMVRKMAEEIRTLSYLLHPPLLDESGLGSAVRWYAEGFQKRSSIQLSVDIAPDLERLPAEVETALFRVVQESLTNVHRYSGSPNAEIQISTDGGQVKLEVIDHGGGLQVGAARVTLDGVASLGVGIPGMRERLRQLGGQLEVDFGRMGTRVIATVPVRKTEGEGSAMAEPAAASTADENQPSFDSDDSEAQLKPRRRILIADDHEVMRRGVRGLLESHTEWAVCGEAVEGREAVQKSRELKPDLVILDINMPGLTGLGAAQEILLENPMAKILFFSVHESLQTVREVVSAGGQGYVAKSRAGHDLVRAVQEVLEGRTFFPSFANIAHSMHASR